MGDGDTMLHAGAHPAFPFQNRSLREGPISDFATFHGHVYQFIDNLIFCRSREMQGNKLGA
jgi:hypothetical protein